MSDVTPNEWQSWTPSEQAAFRKGEMRSVRRSEYFLKVIRNAGVDLNKFCLTCAAAIDSNEPAWCAGCSK